MANIPTLEQVLEKIDDDELVTIADWDTEKRDWTQVSSRCCAVEVMKSIKETRPNLLNKRVWRVATDYKILWKDETVHTIYIC